MGKIVSELEMYMGIADLASCRSNDPNTQVGCCIVNRGKVVGIGWNDWPKGFYANSFSWDGENDDPIKTKYPFVIHAEMAGILNTNRSDLKDATMYCTLPPCNECAKAIIQSGIKVVVYKGKWSEDMWHIASKVLLRHNQSGVSLIEYRQLFHNDLIKIGWKKCK